MVQKRLFICVATVVLAGMCYAEASDWLLFSSTCKEPLSVSQYIKNTGVAAGSTIQTPDITAPVTSKAATSEPLRVAIVADKSGKVDCYELWGKTNGGTLDRDAISAELNAGLKQWQFKPFTLTGPKPIVLPAHYWFLLKPQDGKLVPSPAPMRFKGLSPED